MYHDFVMMRIAETGVFRKELQPHAHLLVAQKPREDAILSGLYGRVGLFLVSSKKALKNAF